MARDLKVPTIARRRRRGWVGWRLDDGTRTAWAVIFRLRTVKYLQPNDLQSKIQELLSKAVA